MSRKRLAAAFLAALTFAVGGGIAYVRLAPRHTPAGQSPLISLGEGSLASFVEAFNSRPGAARIVLLLSPT